MLMTGQFIQRCLRSQPFICRITKYVHIRATKNDSFAHRSYALWHVRLQFFFLRSISSSALSLSLILVIRIPPSHRFLLADHLIDNGHVWRVCFDVKWNRSANKIHCSLSIFVCHRMDENSWRNVRIAADKKPEFIVSVCPFVETMIISTRPCASYFLTHSRWLTNNTQLANQMPKYYNSFQSCRFFGFSGFDA